MHAPPVAALAEISISRMKEIKSICYTNPALPATSNTVCICFGAVMLLVSHSFTTLVFWEIKLISSLKKHDTSTKLMELTKESIILQKSCGFSTD